MIELGANRYGKAAIRVVRVHRDPAGHHLRDLTVAIALEGDFAAAHTDGDNSLVVATDTMKNTAYAFAKDHLAGAVEEYGRALAEHFLEFGAGGPRDRQHPRPISGGRSTSAGRRRATRSSGAGRGPGSPPCRRTTAGRSVEAGVEDLVVMKTTRSAFSGFPRDELHDPARNR